MDNTPHVLFLGEAYHTKIVTKLLALYYESLGACHQLREGFVDPARRPLVRSPRRGCHVDTPSPEGRSKSLGEDDVRIV